MIGIGILSKKVTTFSTAVNFAANKHYKRSWAILQKSSYNKFLSRSLAILIVPTNACLNFIDCLPNHCFTVETLGMMDESFRLSIDMTSIDAELETTTSEVKHQRRRINKIDQLTTEMRKHYQAAKDYYYASGGQLLPRPTQKDLAKLIGKSQDVVSRCLHDKKATVLRMLWDNADNPEMVLNYK
jgi:hypothetical protein